MLSRQNCQLILWTWVGDDMEAAKPSAHVREERSRKGPKAGEASAAWWHGSQQSKGQLKLLWKEQRCNWQVRADSSRGRLKRTRATIFNSSAERRGRRLFVDEYWNRGEPTAVKLLNCWVVRDRTRQNVGRKQLKYQLKFKHRKQMKR